MSTTQPGGLKEAQRRARLRLSYGHYVDVRGTVYVYCAHCPARIERTWSALDSFRPHSAGHERALRDELAEHLLAEHSEAIA